jgi:hypothetical protein
MKWSQDRPYMSDEEREEEAMDFLRRWGGQPYYAHMQGMPCSGLWKEWMFVIDDLYDLGLVKVVPFPNQERSFYLTAQGRALLALLS